MPDRLAPVAVALGGFLGAVARWLVGAAVAGDGTLLVNVAGSFALADAGGTLVAALAGVALGSALVGV
jgi:CrcB protein